MDVVEYRRLGRIGALIGKGGQAKVYHAPEARLPGVAEGLVYKEYEPGQGPGQGLRPLVRFRNSLERSAQARLDGCTAWPLCVVEDGERVRGILMRHIPPSFMQTLKLPGTGRTVTRPREVQHLLAPAAHVRRMGMAVPDRAQRMAVCLGLAEALYLLHGHGFVYGDLNARNEVYCLGGQPSVLLVDCDAVRKRGSAQVVAQLDAPDWDAPEPLLTPASDRYKFGLFVLRCLGTEGPQLSTTRELARAGAALDAEGQGLLRRALGADPAGRPDIADWGRYLHFRLTGRRDPALFAAQVPQPRRDDTTSTPGWRRDGTTGKWVPQ
ncbi:hypothetical protein [Dactylosporangium darangshiense]|uniref:Protein kinase domain-containing protein n=1 Tax=Dactylosporangium darangshiense TaxID=579108 RepID=A0ABP8D777_9ACTN